ncbi:hypothetical protein FB451DRAFT_1162527 [Mycena latifolia]|nr:hypothetical protein FB451DRAFT_1162527 [Mycena latifolia]
MFKRDEDAAGGAPFAHGTIGARASSPRTLAIRLNHSQIEGDFLRQMTTENQLEPTHRQVVVLAFVDASQVLASSSSPSPPSSPRPIDELLALTQQPTPSKTPRTVRKSTRSSKLTQPGSHARCGSAVTARATFEVPILYDQWDGKVDMNRLFRGNRLLEIYVSIIRGPRGNSRKPGVSSASTKSSMPPRGDWHCCNPDTQFVKVGEETSIDYAVRHRLCVRGIREGLRDKEAWAIGLLDLLLEFYFTSLTNVLTNPAILAHVHANPAIPTPILAGADADAAALAPLFCELAAAAEPFRSRGIVSPTAQGVPDHKYPCSCPGKWAVLLILLTAAYGE